MIFYLNAMFPFIRNKPHFKPLGELFWKNLSTVFSSSTEEAKYKEHVEETEE